MEEEIDKVKQIVDYLDNKLEGQALRKFENRIANDLDLQIEVQSYSRLRDGVIAYGELTLKKELEAIHQRTVTNNTNRFKSIRFWGSIAASVLFLIAFAWWRNFNQNQRNLFEEYYVTYTIPVSSRSTLSEVKLLAANEFYLTGNYERAVSLFEEIEAPDGRVMLALGICYIELNQLEAAQAQFTSLINAPNQDIFQNLAQWYLALSFLKQDDTASAKKWLETLSNNPSADKHEEALQILLELD